MLQYMPVWVSILCAVVLCVVQQLRNVYGFRAERGPLLLSVPVPKERKRWLALRLVAMVAVLLCAGWGIRPAYPHELYVLSLLVLFLGMLGLLWTVFSFVPTHLYENGVLDRFGFTSWLRLSRAGEQAGRFALQVTAQDFAKSLFRRNLFLYCMAEQQDSVRGVLQDRVVAN